MTEYVAQMVSMLVGSVLVAAVTASVGSGMLAILGIGGARAVLATAAQRGARS